MQSWSVEQTIRVRFFTTATMYIIHDLNTFLFWNKFFQRINIKTRGYLVWSLWRHSFRLHQTHARNCTCTPVCPLDRKDCSVSLCSLGCIRSNTPVDHRMWILNMLINCPCPYLRSKKNIQYSDSFHNSWQTTSKNVIPVKRFYAQDLN